MGRNVGLELMEFFGTEHPEREQQTIHTVHLPLDNVVHCKFNFNPYFFTRSRLGKFEKLVDRLYAEIPILMPGEVDYYYLQIPHRVNFGKDFCVEPIVKIVRVDTKTWEFVFSKKFPR